VTDLTDPRLGTVLAGRYRLDERLAAGGMGVVYRGRDTDRGDPVAVKLLHEALVAVPDLVKRFEREAHAMERLVHPHIVRVRDSGVSGGVPFLVMDFHKGKALGDLLDDGAFEPGRAVGLVLQVLEGMAHAHAQEVVHRDLKPDNILVVEEGGVESVKILDFGLAKIDDAATKLTNTGFALGTPAYMSPEQARGAPSDERSDVYSVGVLLFHLVTGRRPFEAESPMVVMRMQLDEAPPKPRALGARISAELERVILSTMEKDPARRPASAAVLIEALRQTPEGTDAPLLDVSLREVPAAPSTARTVVGRKRADSSPAPTTRRGGGRFAAWLTVILLLAAGGVYAWSRLSRRDQATVKKQVGDAVGKARDVLSTAANKAKEAVEALPPPPKPAPPPAPKETPRPASDEDDDDDDEPIAGRDTPGAKLEDATPAPSTVPKVADAIRLVERGKLDEAIQTLYAIRKKQPKRADVALWLGHAYFKKMWRTDGLREYAEAIRLSPGLRGGNLLIKNAVAALDDPTYRAARGLLRKKVGRAALPELRRAARTAKSPRVRERARHLAAQLGGAHAKRRR
jgi:serine/threonine-protein kinase